MSLIDNHFSDFLNMVDLEQDRVNPSHFRNARYDVYFYHDFDGYRPLHTQLPNVQEKYDRRIKRFYQMIEEPTLFVRYLYSQDEYERVRRGLPALTASIKQYNRENEFLFIASDCIETDELQMHQFPIDEGDTVARRFTDKNHELRQLLLTLYDPDKREANLDRLHRDEKRLRRTGWVRTAQRKAKKALFRPQVHDKLYDYSP